MEEALDQHARERLGQRSKPAGGKLAKVSESNLSRAEAREVSPQGGGTVEEAYSTHVQQRLERRGRSPASLPTVTEPATTVERSPVAPSTPEEAVEDLERKKRERRKVSAPTRATMGTALRLA